MNRIKVATLVAFGIFVALSAEAGQPDRKRQLSSFCEDDGDCIGLNAAASKASKSPRSYARASKLNPRRAVDANGNTVMVTVTTAYGFTEFE